MRRAIRNFCWLYVIALAVAILANVAVGLTTNYGEREAVGCNLHDAMLVGMECRGFAGAKAAEIFLNWPFWLLYAPMFAFVSLWGLFATSIVWGPLICLVFTYVRRRNTT
jgi:hypothetical protein